MRRLAATLALCGGLCVVPAVAHAQTTPPVSVENSTVERSVPVNSVVNKQVPVTTLVQTDHDDDDSDKTGLWGLLGLLGLLGLAGLARRRNTTPDRDAPYRPSGGTVGADTTPRGSSSSKET